MKISVGSSLICRVFPWHRVILLLTQNTEKYVVYSQNHSLVTNDPLFQAFIIFLNKFPCLSYGWEKWTFASWVHNFLSRQATETHWHHPVMTPPNLSHSPHITFPVEEKLSAAEFLCTELSSQKRYHIDLYIYLLCCQHEGITSSREDNIQCWIFTVSNSTSELSVRGIFLFNSPNFS